MERDFETGDIALKREPWTVRVAVWSARHRWPVLASWFLLTMGLMFASIALGGPRAQSIMDKGKTIGEADAGWQIMSDAGLKSDVSTEWFYLIVSNPKGQLDTPANRTAIADMTKRLAALAHLLHLMVDEVAVPHTPAGAVDLEDNAFHGIVNGGLLEL